MNWTSQELNRLHLEQMRRDAQAEAFAAQFRRSRIKQGLAFLGKFLVIFGKALQARYGEINDATTIAITTSYFRVEWIRRGKPDEYTELHA